MGKKRTVHYGDITRWESPGAGWQKADEKRISGTMEGHRRGLCYWGKGISKTINRPQEVTRAPDYKKPERRTL